MKGWSLDKTAAATGVSKAMLGQIERQESSPTIATLWKIATGLQCSFSSFITANEANAPQPHLTFSLDASEKCDVNMKVKTLFPFAPDTHFETFEVTLLNYHEQLSTPHQKGVKEYIHVLEGQLEIKQGDCWQIVAAGEQVVLKADLPHGYRDKTGITRFIDIIYYPPILI